MGNRVAPPLLVVIAGPQASGKSTLAGALASDLRNNGEQVALVELDAIAAMALPTLPNWSEAHRIFQEVVTQWMSASLSVVIAEGSGCHDEVIELRRISPDMSRVVVVATTTTVGTAHVRALADPDRGISKDRAFLERIYTAWPVELELISPDLTLDTGTEPLPQCVERLREFITRRITDAQGDRRED